MKLPEALVNFFGLGGIETLRSTHQLTLASFESIQGIEAVVSPIFPAILMCEIAFLVWAWRRSSGKLYAAYKIPVLMYVFNWIIGLLLIVMAGLFTFWLSARTGLSPLIVLPIVFVVSFVVGALLQPVLIEPLMNQGRRAELLSLMVTFGLDYVLVQIALHVWGADYVSLPYLQST